MEKTRTTGPTELISVRVNSHGEIVGVARANRYGVRIQTSIGHPNSSGRFRGYARTCYSSPAANSGCGQVSQRNDLADRNPTEGKDDSVLCPRKAPGHRPART